MSVDPTTGTFQQTINHDINSFLSDLIWNSAAMWGLSQSGLANWVYSMAPSMRGEVAEAIRVAMVIGAAMSMAAPVICPPGLRIWLRATPNKHLRGRSKASWGG